MKDWKIMCVRHNHTAQIQWDIKWLHSYRHSLCEGCFTGGQECCTSGLLKLCWDKTWKMSRLHLKWGLGHGIDSWVTHMFVYIHSFLAIWMNPIRFQILKVENTIHIFIFTTYSEQNLLPCRTRKNHCDITFAFITHLKSKLIYFTRAFFF